jgi:ribose 1,5-bisphosphokinase
MANGLNVVVNGSRAYLDQATELFPDLVPVLVQASQSTLRQRLLARGREGGEELEGRIARAVGLDREVDHPDLRRIDNDADLAEAGQHFLAVLTGHG